MSFPATTAESVTPTTHTSSDRPRKGRSVIRWASTSTKARRTFTRRLSSRLWAISDVNHEGVLVSTRTRGEFSDRFVTERGTQTIRKYPPNLCEFDDIELDYLEPFFTNFNNTSLWATGIAQVTTSCDRVDSLRSPVRLRPLQGHSTRELCRQPADATDRRRTRTLRAFHERDGAFTLCTQDGRLLHTTSFSRIRDDSEPGTYLRRVALVGDAILLRAYDYDPGYGDTPPSGGNGLLVSPINRTAGPQRAVRLRRATQVVTAPGAAAWVTSAYEDGARLEQEIWISDRSGPRRVATYTTSVYISDLKIGTDDKLRYTARQTFPEVSVLTPEIPLKPLAAADVALDPRGPIK